MIMVIRIQIQIIMIIFFRGWDLCCSFIPLAPAHFLFLFHFSCLLSFLFFPFFCRFPGRRPSSSRRDRYRDRDRDRGRGKYERDRDRSDRRRDRDRDYENKRDRRRSHERERDFDRDKKDSRSPERTAAPKPPAKPGTVMKMELMGLIYNPVFLRNVFLS